MIDDLRASFLTRFVSTARERVARAKKGDAAVVRAEAHAIAGEAGLLELTDISALARQVERSARAWLSGDAAQAGTCASGLAALEEAIARL